ncbi:MAG: hypothetical protein ACE5KW_02090 [Dehalococcoidia bacterium]
MKQEERSFFAELAKQKGLSWHIPDEVRVGVLAGTEEHEVWLQAHLLRCQDCLTPLLTLYGKLPLGPACPTDPSSVDCSEARNAIFHYLETGREPAWELLCHITICEACSQPFYESAKNRVLLEYDPDEIGEAG